MRHLAISRYHRFSGRMSAEFNVMFLNMGTVEFDVNGQWPDIGGKILNALLCQEYYYRGVLAEPANVVYLHVNSIWHRLSLDCGVIFWRTQEASPESFEAPEIKAEYKVINLGNKLGVVGNAIEKIEPFSIQGGVGVSVSFSQGKKVIFKNQNDTTTYET